VSSETLRYIICYDILNDKRRAKVAKCLDGFGDRIQFSVFEAVLDHALFEKLIGKLRKLIDQEEDQIRAYTLCLSCAAKVRRLGKLAEGPAVGEETVFIV